MVSISRMHLPLTDSRPRDAGINFGPPCLRAVQKESETLKKWNARYVVLKHRTLSYFHDADEHDKGAHARAVMDLEGCTISQLDDLRFSLTSPREERRKAQQKGQFVWVLQGTTMAETAEWVRLLRLALRPLWVEEDDARAAQCAVCRTAFNVTNRQHHCRQCGQVVCETCSGTTMPLPDLEYAEAVRVCDRCRPGGPPAKKRAETDGSEEGGASEAERAEADREARRRAFLEEKAAERAAQRDSHRATREGIKNKYGVGAS